MSCQDILKDFAVCIVFIDAFSPVICSSVPYVVLLFKVMSAQSIGSFLWMMVFFGHVMEYIGEKLQWNINNFCC